MLVDDCPTGMPATNSQNENDEDFILQYGGNDECVNIISP
jgi:hypothetical protein